MTGYETTARRRRSPLLAPDKHVMFICVDEWMDGPPKGRILNACFPDELEFVGLGQMLLEMDWLCDQLRISQSYMELRQSSPRRGRRHSAVDWNHGDYAESVKSADDLWLRFGSAHVFSVRIQYRMHATWQGMVQLGGRSGKQVPFRSALELITLMDGALHDETEKIETEERGIAAW